MLGLSGLVFLEKKFIHLFGEIRWVKNLYDGELFTIGIKFVYNAPKNIITLMEQVFKKPIKD